jgi:hypothetical protein
MSNRLTVLAADIRNAHADIGRSNQYSAERAVDAGRWLLEAQQEVPNGQWLAWVETETRLPVRTASQYMRLAHCVSEQLATVADIAEAGQNGALDAAAGEAGRREPKLAAVAAAWTREQQVRREAAEITNTCVVANMHEGADEALIAWAKESDRFVRIDRRSDWGNPFEMPDDGERADVVGKFTRFYLPHKDGLLARMPTLRGKVLGCWCHPEECHGHVIAEIVNGEAVGLGTAEQLADQVAEADG